VGGGTRPGWSCIIVAGATVGGFAATAGPRRPPLLSPEPPPEPPPEPHISCSPLLPVALIPNPDAAKRVHVAVTSRAPVDVTDKLATVSVRRHQHDTEHLFALRTLHTAEHRAQVVP
jgi:hypothetical protein